MFLTRALFILLLIFAPLSVAYSAAKKDETVQPDSTIIPDQIFDYIKSERQFLRGKHKVDLVSEFKSKSNTFGKRYGNTKRVLNLRSLSLSGADLRGVDLTMADMTRTDFSGAKFNNANLVHVDFEGANLANADFTNADLSNVQFVNTNLEGTIFKGANLFKAKFEKVSGIRGKDIKALRKLTNSYINLEKEPLPDYYAIQQREEEERRKK